VEREKRKKEMRYFVQPFTYITDRILIDYEYKDGKYKVISIQTEKAGRYDIEYIEVMLAQERRHEEATD
jgi:hypothetical protein